MMGSENMASSGWRVTQHASRQRLLELYDAAGVDQYIATSLQAADDQEQALLADLAPHVTFHPGMQVLDVGAGTGAMCRALLQIPGLELTALEPAPAMLAAWADHPEFDRIRKVVGFCDHADDCHQFAPATFDMIVSRQLLNGLYDPLTAFRNWRQWLKPGGHTIVADGLFERASWTGAWAEQVDGLPMSAVQTMAMLPYLLEATGFQVVAVARLDRTNALSSTRTPRYAVVARRLDVR